MAGAPLKPHLKRVLRRGGWAWQCTTRHVSYWGNQYTRIGIGYSLRDAYDHWRRSR